MSYRTIIRANRLAAFGNRADLGKYRHRDSPGAESPVSIPFVQPERASAMFKAPIHAKLRFM